jgi:pimeloyl-ACP methyl ester carboxylesterase
MISPNSELDPFGLGTGMDLSCCELGVEMPLYAFNGTWNTEKTEDLQTSVHESDANTNVIRFRDAYGRNDTFYINGVGTKLGWFGKAVGGAFGAGGFGRLAEAMAHLRERVHAGEKEIDIVGFSRGAALALAFANRIAGDKALRDSNGRPPRIRFLGLFDVVGSFGLAMNLGPLNFQRYNIGYQLTLPTNVEYCFHAMALDERRQTFGVTRIKGAYEVWFRGAHSDVGGGNENLGLNAIPLAWMLRKATACGLPMRAERLLDAAALCRPTTPPLWASFDPIANRMRQVAKGDRVHHSVVIPSGLDGCNDPALPCVREESAHEVAVERSTMFAR